MNKKLFVAAASAWAVTGTLALAQTTTFGPLPAATFGGTGDPNSEVEVTTLTAGNGDAITLGLAAQQRYSNPALGISAPAVYTATTGANYGDPANPTAQTFSTSLGSTWNFDFYANVVGNSDHRQDNVSGYNFILTYQLTPGGPTGTQNLNTAANTLSALAGGPATFTGSTIQDSENLNFPYLATSSGPLGVTAPGVSFDPNAVGVYNFTLEVDTLGGTELASESIQVDVSAVPDASTTAPMFALALGGLAVFASRKNRSQATR